MCTLTVVKQPNNGWLITMNRDEAVERLEGEPIKTLKNNQLYSWRPVDELAGGSWFGVTKGRAMALLNRYQDADVFNAKIKNNNLKNIQQNPKVVLESRGLLIEELLTCESYLAIEQALEAFTLRQFAPFDLWLIDVKQEKPLLRSLSWTGSQWLNRQSELPETFFHTSSSVDFEQAKAFRLQAFNALLQSYQNNQATHNTVNISAKNLLNLHQARCDANPSLGFNMQRPGRHTKSICQAVITPEGFNINYYQAPFKV